MFRARDSARHGQLGSPPEMCSMHYFGIQLDQSTTSDGCFFVILCELSNVISPFSVVTCKCDFFEVQMCVNAL